MSVERNIIFLYPISEKLKELKVELEKDEIYIIYELDSVAEYGQVIGIMEHSITLSSDLKKTTQYLTECKKAVKAKTARNFLIQGKTILPHIFTKFQRAGLNEVIQEELPLKSILHKFNMFFAPFDQKEKAEEEAKNKAITSNIVMTETIGDDSKKSSYDGKEKLHVEKMATLEEDDGKPKTKKKRSGFDPNLMFNNSDFSNFELRPNKSGESFLKNPFDNLQRKKVAQFNAVTGKDKLKKSNFTPIEQEYGQNPYKGLGIKKPGELKRKKIVDINFDQSDYKKKKASLDLADEELKKRRAKFEEVNNESNKKKKKFEEFYEDLKRKKITNFDEIDPTGKKKKRFDEYIDELGKKRKNIEFADQELGKKKKAFDEVELDYEKKRKEFEEIELDLDKKKSLHLELAELDKKRKSLFSEVEGLAKKKKKFIEVEIERPEVKKVDLDEEADLEKKKGLSLDEISIGKKKGNNFEEAGVEKERKQFEETEQDLDKKKKRFDEFEHSDNKKRKTFEEVEIERKKQKGGMDFAEEDNNKKKGSFDEAKKEKMLKAASEIEIGKSSKTEEELNSLKEKNGEEQALDYRKFKKEYAGGSESEIALKDERATKHKIKEILEEPEYTFYENKSFGLEYLIIHNDFLLKENITAISLFKFIHFALIKEYDGDVSFYVSGQSSADDESSADVICLYSGHRVRKNDCNIKDFDEFEKTNNNKWSRCQLPTWEDETYQIEVNEFVYPYFEDGKILGYAVSHFGKGVTSHEDAAKVELFVMCLKGSIMEEFENKNGK